MVAIGGGEIKRHEALSIDKEIMNIELFHCSKTHIRIRPIGVTISFFAKKLSLA